MSRWWSVMVGAKDDVLLNRTLADKPDSLGGVLLLLVLSTEQGGDEDETGVDRGLAIVPDWSWHRREEEEENTAECRNADNEEEDDVDVIMGVVVEEDGDRVAAGEVARRDLEWGWKDGGCNANDNDAIGLFDVDMG